MNAPTNPLSKYKRQPVLYIRLPSQGKWWPTGSIEIPPNLELPVFGMNARDEILLKTPDALMNGASTVEVIQSCCPNIRNAWELPIIDLDTVLISIRIATYGNAMDTFSVCPHCKKRNEHTVNLHGVLDRIKTPDYDKKVNVNGLEIHLRPPNFHSFNQISIETYEQQRLLAVVSDSSLSDEEKLAKFSGMFTGLVSKTVSRISRSVAAIRTEDGILVDDQKFLEDFFSDCSKDVWNAVQKQIEENAELIASSKVIDVECEHDDCLKPYSYPIEFESSHFFV